MIARPVIAALLLPLILATVSEASPRHGGIYPETILQQEIVLNELISNLHRLQIDFQDHEARDQLQENRVELSNFIDDLPKRTNDKESSQLLATIISLWPVISRHANWLASLPARSTPPEAAALLRALAKLDRQLLLLRQTTLVNKPGFTRQLRFLEQALMMQRMTREYLNLVVSGKIGNPTVSSEMQLKTLAVKFSQRLEGFKKELGNHPHASKPLRQSHAAWAYIQKSFDRYPDKQVPSLIVRYGNRIVNKLTSVHRMF